MGRGLGSGVFGVDGGNLAQAHVAVTVVTRIIGGEP